MKPHNIHAIAEFEKQLQESLELAQIIKLSAEEIETVSGGSQENPPRLTGKIVLPPAGK
ncbi:hypothetical protein [Chromobacterium phragmitis]|uniref:Bacteriocin n=1 Tax=Chromobacterium phragmitis TaxID=2202141 RepID=A0ABV0IYU5_9NEIS|nr:hypothetical protein [Chromobacterium phragmitis]